MSATADLFLGGTWIVKDPRLSISTARDSSSLGTGCGWPHLRARTARSARWTILRMHQSIEGGSVACGAGRRPDVCSDGAVDEPASGCDAARQHRRYSTDQLQGPVAAAAPGRARTPAGRPNVTSSSRCARRPPHRPNHGDSNNETPSRQRAPLHALRRELRRHETGLLVVRSAKRIRVRISRRRADRV